MGSALSRLIGAIALVLFVTTVPSAQTITDGRTWWSVRAIEAPDADSNWHWLVNVQGRIRDGVDVLDHLLVFTGAGYDVSDQSTLWMGYAYTPRFPVSGGVTHEQRFFPQFVWRTLVGMGAVAVRTRLEARVIEGNNRVAWRLREQLRLSHPVQVSRRVTAVISNEVFLHINTSLKARKGFHQNWFFAGVNIVLFPSAVIETGYLNQFVASSSGADQMNHILSSTLSLRF